MHQVLSLENSGLRQPMLPLDMSVYSLLCCLWTCLFYRILCCLAASARVCPSVLQEIVLPPNVFVTQKTVLPLDLCLFSGSLCCPWTCLVYSSLAAPGRGCSTAAFAALAWTCLFYSSLCCPWTCLCLFYSSAVCTIPGGVWLAATCASTGCIYSTAAFAAVSESLCSTVQQLVLHM